MMYRIFGTIGLVLLSMSIACQGETGQRSEPSLELPNEVMTIGALDGSEAEMFAGIGDVEVGEDGSIFILDRLAVAVTRFNDRGEVIGSYRAAGEGPGEMDRPQDMELVGDTLLVLDPGRMAIHSFFPAATGLEYMGWIRLANPGWSLCAIRDRVFLHYLLDGHLLHEVTRRGELVRSFAPMPEVPRTARGNPPNVQFQFLRSQGPIGCFHDPDTIVLIGGLSPQLRAFGADGELLWETEIADHRSGIFQSGGGSDVDWQISNDGSHVASHMVRWDDHSFLLQLQIRYPVSAAWTAGQGVLDSRLIDLRDGRELARADTLPQLRAAVGDRMVGWQHEPFPRVLIYERR